MTWQLIAIWIIGGATVLAFAFDELHHRAAARRAPIAPARSLLAAKPAEMQPGAIRPPDPTDLAFAERRRRAQLKSIGF